MPNAGFSEALLVGSPALNRDSSDEALVDACRRGDEAAWAALIDKYKRLIYSIPVKYGFSREEAAEIFQATCFELLRALPALRQPTALPAWLIRTAAHQCHRHRDSVHRWNELEDAGALCDEKPCADEIAVQAQREYLLEAALGDLSPRCRELMEMLFYEEPPRPYREIAARLGLAEGSIGLTRSRCLEKLRRHLEKAGFR
jgi:RNA polymerase sigma factor (sigma-70 family)